MTSNKQRCGYKLVGQPSLADDSGKGNAFGTLESNFRLTEQL